MKLYFMTEDALAYFRGNVKNNLRYYKDDDTDWVKTVYPDNPLQEFKFKVNIIDDYDLLEYKVNDNPWVKLDDKTFTLQKQNKNLYVQARIKKNNQYFYSNVFRYKII